VNSQIIGTSVYWRFEFISGMVLLTLMLPLTYVLTKSLGIVGAGISNLVSITIYNTIRILFLWRKFRFFPFTRASLYTLFIAGACLGICYFGFRNLHGLMGMLLRTIVFLILYGTSVVYLELSPDIKPLWANLRNRLGKGK
jgi:Polysaccharide biosynthesis C-terminal domain